MNREQIIHSMCMTYRHDYGLLSSEERASINRTMSQIFDNDVAPHMTFKPSQLDQYWANQNQYSE
jgi:hypothetical protein